MTVWPAKDHTTPAPLRGAEGKGGPLLEGRPWGRKDPTSAESGLPKGFWVDLTSQLNTLIVVQGRG